MHYTPINPQKLSDSIVSHIEELILNGLLKPGDKLPAERELAKELDVSRTSLREAMVKLESRGLLQVRHSSGTYVRDIIGPTLTDPLVHLLTETPSAMLDLLEIRESLEKTAARFAATRATGPDRAILEKCFSNLNQHTENGDPNEDAIAIAEYYLAIADASHNIALMHVMRGLFNLMRTSISHSLATIYQHPGVYENIHAARNAMHQAILAGDPNQAVDATDAVITTLHNAYRDLRVQPLSVTADFDAETFLPVDNEAMRPGRLSDAVVAQIEQLILKGKLKAGDQLPPEKDLADKLTVSRAVLRDAVVRLEARGVLTIRQGGGTFVCDVPGPTVDDPLAYLLESHPEAIFDFLHLRGPLEELCAAYAAERHNPGDLMQLRERLEQVRQAVSSPDPFDDAESVTGFHLALAEASHNVALLYIVRGLYILLRTSVRNNLERMSADAAIYNLVLRHHEEILDAVERRDVAAAQQAARVHIHFVNESLSQLGIEQKRLARSERRARSLLSDDDSQA